MARVEGGNTFAELVLTKSTGGISSEKGVIGRGGRKGEDVGGGNDDDSDEDDKVMIMGSDNDHINSNSIKRRNLIGQISSRKKTKEEERD